MEGEEFRFWRAGRGSMDGPGAPVEISLSTPAAEAQDCPTCKQLVTELCGDDVVQQSWFRLAPQARLCTVHQDFARMRRWRLIHAPVS